MPQLCVATKVIRVAAGWVDPTLSRGLGPRGPRAAYEEGSRPLREASTFVGLDVHKKDIAVALLTPGSKDPL